MQVTNDSSHWRAFEENQVTHSVAHYLMAIHRLRDEQGYARATDVAGLLGISRGATSLALSHLKDRGLVKEDPNRILFLTEEGDSVARKVEHNYALLVRFFENVLGVSSDSAKTDACKMEHLLSEESSRALVQFLRLLFSGKHCMKELLDEMNRIKKEEGCQETLCPLCEPVGECLSPPMNKELS